MRLTISMLFGRFRGRHVAVVILTGASFLLQQSAFAHDSPGDQIANVTAEIIRSPSDPKLFLRRADLYRATRQYKEALSDLDRAAHLDSTVAAVDLVRAHVFLDAGDPKAAANAASRFLTRQPGHTDALIVLGRAYVRLGRARDAAIDFTRALDVTPMPDLYIERARAVVTSGPAGIEDALRGLDEGIRRLGPLVTLELEAIDLELRLNRYDAALTRLDRVWAPVSRKESWLARRGAILEAAGRIDEARATYHAALSAAMSLPAWTRQTQASSALIERLHSDLTRLGVDRPIHTRKSG